MTDAVGTPTARHHSRGLERHEQHVWLASYPKSGNTWVRMLISALALPDGEQFDINRSSEPARGVASARSPFDYFTLIDSGVLTHDEIERYRPRLHEQLALEEETVRDAGEFGPPRFMKVHDAYTMTALGEPLLAADRGATSAIVIVRDPRDVAPSLASHRSTTIDDAITFMSDPQATLSAIPGRQHRQLRQRLLDWSGHVASWLDQQDLPIHLVRYEDLKENAAAVLLDAMSFAGRLTTRRDAERAMRAVDFATLQRQERERGFSEASRRGSPFFRKGRAGAWREELTPEQVANVESPHASMMTRLGYALSTESTTTRGIGQCH